MVGVADPLELRHLLLWALAAAQLELGPSELDPNYIFFFHFSGLVLQKKR